VAFALAVAPAADARKLTVHVPAPGHISVQVVKLTVKGKQRGLPKRLKLRPQKLGSLPPSVRVLYAQRTIRRKRSTVYSLALLTVNVAKPGAAKATQEPVQINDFFTFLIFLASPDAAVQFQKSGGVRGDPSMKMTEDSWGAFNADLIKEAKGLTDALGLVIDPNGDGKIDPGLDTGHYDDGHAFGWGIKTNADEKKTWGELVKQSLDQYIAALEEGFQYDVDGDGAVEKPAPPGQHIDTQVGAPVVTGGGS
jgi:hypothetical protein